MIVGGKVKGGDKRKRRSDRDGGDSDESQLSQRHHTQRKFPDGEKSSKYPRSAKSARTNEEVKKEKRKSNNKGALARHLNLK